MDTSSSTISSSTEPSASSAASSTASAAPSAASASSASPQQAGTLHDMLLSSIMHSRGEGGFPFLNIIRMNSNRGAVRGAKLAASRQRTTGAAADWAATRGEKPYTLEDLATDDEVRSRAASDWYRALSLSDTKSESALHGLPVSGSRAKQFDALFDKALTTKYSRKLNTAIAAIDRTQSTSKVGEPGSRGSVQTNASAEMIRRKLAADLKAGFVYDKKLKKGNKMIKASSCVGVGPGVFHALFPQAAKFKGQKANGPIAISESDLGVSLVKTLRYGATLAVVPGSLKAKQTGHQALQITVTGKICMLR
jgi:hypothetical protein